MIKANELRLNNWYTLVRGKGHIDIQMDEPTISEIFSGRAEYSLNDFEPIPLTEEWHNRFGVSKNGFHAFEYELEQGKLIVFSGDYVYLRDLVKYDGFQGPEDDLCVLWNNDKRGRGMYVHEWQNLFYSLRGEELTLNQSTK
jgi:hypothetical protein